MPRRANRSRHPRWRSYRVRFSGTSLPQLVRVFGQRATAPHSTRSRQTVKIESQTLEVLDCRWNSQAGMPSNMSCQAHGRRNAVPYGQQRPAHLQPRNPPAPPLTGTEGSNPSPSSGESSANLTFGGSSRGQFGSEPLVPLERFRADRLRFRGSIPRFIWSFYANISKYDPNARSCT